MIVMVGGPRHGTCCAGPTLMPDYKVETVVTRNPENFVRRNTVAVHTDLLAHRKIPGGSIMYQASEDALHAYILDALFRVVGRE